MSPFWKSYLACVANQNLWAGWIRFEWADFSFETRGTMAAAVEPPIDVVAASGSPPKPALIRVTSDHIREVCGLVAGARIEILWTIEDDDGAEREVWWPATLADGAPRGTVTIDNSAHDDADSDEGRTTEVHLAAPLHFPDGFAVLVSKLEPREYLDHVPLDLAAHQPALIEAIEQDEAAARGEGLPQEAVEWGVLAVLRASAVLQHQGVGKRGPELRFAR